MSKDDLLNQLDEADDVGSGVGKGVYCQVEVNMGIKTFAQGLTGQDTLITYDPTKKDSDKAAIEKVTNILTAAGMDATNPSQMPRRVIAFTCFASTVVGSTWKSDLTKLIPTWTPGWIQKAENKGDKPLPGPAKEALQKLISDGVFLGFGKKYWGHMRVIPDPSGRKNKTTGQVETIWFLDQIFKNEAEMHEAASASGADQPAEAVGEPVPEGWPAEVWAQTKPDILEACEKGKWTIPTMSKVAKDFELPLDFVKGLKPA